MKLKPINSRVILKPFKEEKKKTGLIEIPDSAKKKVNDMAIIVRGPEYLEDSESEIKIGDKVIFDIFEVKHIMFEEEEYLVAEWKDIFAVVEED